VTKNSCAFNAEIKTMIAKEERSI